MEPTSPLLVCTDPRDDLESRTVRAHLRPDGALVPRQGLARDVVDAALHRLGVVVLARDPSPAAIRTIADLCARARETRQLAVVLRRGAFTGAWPAHPVSAVADIPEWLWTDARAAWTSFVDLHPVDPCDGSLFQRVGRLVYLVGDRRSERAAHSLLGYLYRRFPPLVRQRTDGFFVPSLLHGGVPLRFPSVVPHRSAEQTYAQAWLLVPDGETNPVLEIVDLGVDMLDDCVSPAGTLRPAYHGDSDGRTARALAALHSERRSFGLLHRIVDAIEPMQSDEEGEDVTPPSRRALLKHLMAALGDPPQWREARMAHCWHAELDGEPAKDWMGGRRVEEGLEADNEDGRIVVVACDLEANRLLPPAAWRRPGFVRQRHDDPGQDEGSRSPPRGLAPSAPEDSGPGIVPLDEAGAPRAPLAVVRYGDRLPRGEPALLVLVGRSEVMARMSEELERDCTVPIVECALDGAASAEVPSCPSAEALVRKLASFCEARGDRPRVLDARDLADLVNGATHGRLRNVASNSGSDEGGGAQANAEPKDDRYDEAIAVVLRSRKCSTSWLQRTLNVGYQRATRLVDRMEREGFVGPAKDAKGRRDIRIGADGQLRVGGS